MEAKKKIIAVIIMCAAAVGLIILIFAINANKGEKIEKESKLTTATSVVETTKEIEPETESSSQEESFVEESETEDASNWDSYGAPASITRGSNGYVVAIDAGHQAYGNFDQEPNGPNSDVYKAKVAGGTSGVATGKPEYQLTLEIALLLKQELINRGYSVVMIRESNDVDISNAERARMANDAGANAFIRIHANGLNDSSVRGALSICQSPANPYNGNVYSQSRYLSECVINSYCAATGFSNRGVSESDSMTGINWSNVPNTIIEMGFMTNADEDLEMSDPTCQQYMAYGIANGIDAYFGL